MNPTSRISGKAAFLTDFDDFDPSKSGEFPEKSNIPPTDSQVISELEAERLSLQSQVSALLDQLSTQRKPSSTVTGFVPLASIFPMKRDPFGESKSAFQQVKIYRKEWERVFTRFTRANDVNYAYLLDHKIEQKVRRVKSLEQTRTNLKTSNKALEREIIRLKSEKNASATAAEMTNLASHVTLLRDQIRTLESVEVQNRDLFAAAEIRESRAESRYGKMKAKAKQANVSLKQPEPDTVKKDYALFSKRLEQLQRQGPYKLTQRVKELVQEKERYVELARELETLYNDQEVGLTRSRVELAQLQQTQGSFNPKPPGLAKSSSQKIMRDASLPATSRRFDGNATMSVLKDRDKKLSDRLGLIEGDTGDIKQGS